MRLFLIPLLILLTACQSLPTDKKASESLSESELQRPDPHSLANFEDVVITHLKLELKTDFADKALKGHVVINYKKLNPDVKYMVLDTRDLKIRRVSLANDSKQQLSWQLGQAEATLGSALRIKLPEGEAAIRIDYQTHPKASGLQWLNPTQTATAKHPFLFSQSQAIHARSWIPLQDTPAVRFTYQAQIEVPSALRAVMSAKNNPEINPDGIYQFDMPQAIPSYLMAIAVGDLQYKKISEHVAIYAEQPFLEPAAYEFAKTEDMITAAEKLYGEYRWGDYDLLVLPPSFPFGGMENPRLSFITPTVIAGDRSLDSLIAHELAHSWSGNLVTNARWCDLWLNEGFTSYIEARLVEAVHGQQRMIMEAALNLQGLQKEMADLPEAEQRLSTCEVNLDSEDVFSGVAYDKGRFFLEWMEKQVGRADFDAFLNQYFDHFAFKSVTSKQFIAYLQENLMAQHADKLPLDIVNTWIYGPGLPDVLYVPVTDKFEVINDNIAAWHNGTRNLADIETDKWTTQEWLHFLRALPTPLDKQTMQQLDKTFDLSNSQNSEIAHDWLLLSIRYHYEPAYSRLIKYLTTIGRMKLIVPLYKAMMETDELQHLAQRIYQKARPGYHPLAQSAVDPIVNHQSDNL
ncbi:M1 family metallopeptidase [Marinicella gelatinilytica]|uniref:M1 family metallopeptidase n=1 Tax=Marinicella gelatinilytica TaxID=2996017 RepID=UPI0022608189|nr:M1 family metallopeptidase [Marinicella gelatinilytica]MCX7544220.1 M1 family metallopeptidase [Marinicella gelatinilytica]